MGKYTLKLDLLHSNICWFSAKGVSTIKRSINVVDSGKKAVGGYIIVDFSDKRLYFFQKNGEIISYPIAHGTPSTPTPVRTWMILEKTHRSMTAPMSARHMRLYAWNGRSWSRTGYGIHGTPWPWTIGTAASHGCIRMYNKDVIELYPLVPLGTKVTTRL